MNSVCCVEKRVEYFSLVFIQPKDSDHKTCTFYYFHQDFDSQLEETRANTSPYNIQLTHISWMHEIFMNIFIPPFRTQILFMILVKKQDSKYHKCSYKVKMNTQKSPRRFQSYLLLDFRCKEAQFQLQTASPLKCCVHHEAQSGKHGLLSTQWYPLLSYLNTSLEKVLFLNSRQHSQPGSLFL